MQLKYCVILKVVVKAVGCTRTVFRNGSSKCCLSYALVEEPGHGATSRDCKTSGPKRDMIWCFGLVIVSVAEATFAKTWIMFRQLVMNAV